MNNMLLLFSLVCACLELSGACSCWPEKGPDQYCRFDIILKGMAMAEYEERRFPIDHSDPLSVYAPDSDWVYTVTVDQAIVMPRNLTGVPKLRVRTPTQDSLCGTRLPLDVQLIIFAFVNYDGEVETGLCAPNAVWGSLSQWEQELMTDHIADHCANKDKVIAPPEPGEAVQP